MNFIYDTLFFFIIPKICVFVLIMSFFT